MNPTTRLFTIDNSVTVKAYFYQFRTHLEQLDLVRQNSQGVFDKSLTELMPSDKVRNLRSAAEYLIQNPGAESAETIDGLTLSRR